MSVPMFAYDETISPVHRALTLCLRSRHADVDLIELDRRRRELGSDQLHAAARANRIEMCVGSTLMEAFGPNAVDRDWRSAVGRNRARVELMIDELAQAVDHAELHDEHALLEGGGMLLATRFPSAAFGAGDFDVLTTEAAGVRLGERLVERGFQAVPRPHRISSSRVEYRKRVGEHEVWFAVGPRAFGRMWVEDDFRERETTWLARAVASPKCAELRVLESTDLLVACAVHTSTHVWVRSPGLRLHIDVDRVASDCNVDWALAVGELLAMRAARRGFVSLAVAVGLLNTSVPEWVLRALAPRAWRWFALRRLLRRASAFEVDRPKLGRLETLAVDVLASDRAPGAWAHAIAAPSERWMRARFGRSPNDSLALLHLRRISGIMGWQPR